MVACYTACGPPSGSVLASSVFSGLSHILKAAACTAGRGFAGEEDPGSCQRDRHAPGHAAHQGAAARVSQKPPNGRTPGTTSGKPAAQKPNCPGQQPQDVAGGQ